MITRENKKNKRIGVVVSWVSPVSINFLKNLKQCIEPIADNILFVIGTSDIIHVLKSFDSKLHIIYHSSGKRTISRILRYILLELRISSKIITERNTIDIWIFFKGSEGLLIPVIIAKLLRKKVVLFIVGSFEKEGTIKGDMLFMPLKWFKLFNCIISNTIILFSKNLIPYWQMEKYRHKILISHQHFLDFSTFKITTPLPYRHQKIGYIGRLSAEKGIQNFVQALPIILNEQHDLHVLIGGDGQLKESITTSLEKEKIYEHVYILGWIADDDLPKYLNQLRLLVLPSFTEGLPYIILEAMACGTPVLATPVGAIPDIICDGETGFIMEDNSPECIAKNVIRALNYPDLKGLSDQGKRFVEEKFTFEKALERWKEILKTI